MTNTEKIKAEIERRLKDGEKKILLGESNPYWDTAVMSTLANLLSFISTLESDKPMDKGCPDSTELIAMWKETKAMLEEKDFRRNSWRLAYNAFLEGFAKGITY